MTHTGYRLERHKQHMAAVRALQRRHQLQRVERVLMQHVAWKRAGVKFDSLDETIVTLQEMREQIEAEMRAEGQEP